MHDRHRTKPLVVLVGSCSRVRNVAEDGLDDDAQPLVCRLFHPTCDLVIVTIISLLEG
jgi:hypothetical protein